MAPFPHGFNEPASQSFMILVLVFLCHHASAAVITFPQNATEAIAFGSQIAPSWVDEPKTRGTMGILVSCTLTIGLAVWSTMLINIQMSASGTMKSVLKDLKKQKEQAAYESQGDGSGEVSTIRKYWTKAKTFLFIQTNFEFFVGWKYKVVWAVLALLVPELPLAVALGETWFARDLLKEVKKHGGETFEKWTASMANYVVMGGFYLINPNEGQDRKFTGLEQEVGIHNLKDRLGYIISRRVNDADGRKKGENECPNEKVQDVLTPHGFLFIARFIGALRKRIAEDPTSERSRKDQELVDQLDAHINDITESALKDFSKVDSIARLFVCIQAFWMFVQVCGRLAQSLPVALLELHTGLHAACAMVMYIVWWNKPKDVTVTTPIYLPKVQYDYMRTCVTEDVTNHLRIRKYARKMLQSKSAPSDPEDIDIQAVEPDTDNEKCIAPNLHDDPPALPPRPGHLFSRPTPTPQEKGIGVVFMETVVDKRKLQAYWSHLLDLSDAEEHNAFYLTSQGTLSKENYKQITGRQSFRGDPFRAIVQVITHLVFTWDRWPGKALIWFITSLLYGVAHLASWTWHFPSRTESILWHICTVYTVGSIANLFFLALLVAIYVPFFKLKHNHDVNKTNCILKFLGSNFITKPMVDAAVPGLQQVVRHGLRFVSFTVAIGIWPWLLARFYMLVEAYISLRSLENDAFRTIAWAEYIPHIS